MEFGMVSDFSKLYIKLNATETIHRDYMVHVLLTNAMTFIKLAGLNQQNQIDFVQIFSYFVQSCIIKDNFIIFFKKNRRC